MIEMYIGSIAEKGMRLLEAHKLDLPTVSVCEELSREGRWVVYILVGLAATEAFNIDEVRVYGNAGPVYDKSYAEIFNSFTETQKLAVYEIIGRLIEYYKGGPYD